VPLIAPLVVLNARPLGSAGATDHVVTAPPVFVGVNADNGTPVVSASDVRP
jgi:hypothetical protein